MNRITPEMVVEAYEKTGLKPVRENFYYASEGIEEGVNCACGIGAIYAASGGKPLEEVADTYARELFGRRYTLGFINGFDGDLISAFRLKDEDFVQGYADGQACWEAVKDKAVEIDEQG